MHLLCQKTGIKARVKGNAYTLVYLAGQRITMRARVEANAYIMHTYIKHRGINRKCVSEVMRLRENKYRLIIVI